MNSTYYTDTFTEKKKLRLNAKRNQKTRTKNYRI